MSPQPLDAVAARVLDRVDALRDEMMPVVAELVRVPSISGTDAEHDAQAFMAERAGAARQNCETSALPVWNEIASGALSTQICA